MQANRPNDAPSRTRIDDVAFAVCLSAFAAALTAFAGIAAAAEPPSAQPPAATTSERVVGTFTGVYVNGAAVYRLPPIGVSASRPAESARAHRENAQGEPATAAADLGAKAERTAPSLKPSA